MILDVDEDATGAMEFGEFLKVMRRKPQHSHTQQELSDAFEHLCLGSASDGVAVGEVRMDVLRKWLEAYRPGNHAFLTGKDDASGLTQPQIMEMREAFAVFDNDNDGHVTAEEIGKVLHRMGQHVTPEEIDEMMKDHDRDKSGSLEFTEFLKMMAAKMRQVAFLPPSS